MNGGENTDDSRKRTTGPKKTCVGKKNPRRAVTLHIDPVSGLLAASMLEKFMPAILSKLRDASDAGKVDALSESVYCLLDELSSACLAKLRIAKSIDDNLGDIELL